MLDEDALTSYFWSGDTLRSRSVVSSIHKGTSEAHALSARLLTDCEREINILGLVQDDVGSLPLAYSR